MPTPTDYSPISPLTSHGRRKSLSTRKTLPTDTPAEIALKQAQREINRVHKQESRRRKRECQDGPTTRATTNQHERVFPISLISPHEMCFPNTERRVSYSSWCTDTSSPRVEGRWDSRQCLRRACPTIDLRHAYKEPDRLRRSSFLGPTPEEKPLRDGGLILPPPYGSLTPPQSPNNLPPLATVIAGTT